VIDDGMERAMRGAATEAETNIGPLSPELVLVSPELREPALRELDLRHQRNGVKPHSDLLDLARARADDHDDVEHGRPTPEPTLLLVAGAAAVRAAVLAAVFVAAVAGAAFGLTIAPGETEPRLAMPANQDEAGRPVERAWRSRPEPRPARLQPAGRGIGTATVLEDMSRLSERPAGLTSHGQLVWNLDALVRDVFGNQPVCLLAGNQLSSGACSASPQSRTAYRTTFIGAEGSSLGLSKKQTAPLLQGRAIPLKLGASYISCGRQRWIAAGANFALSCARERPKRSR
jgi:hypothetical protein